MPNDPISREAVTKLLTDEMKACKEDGAIGAANTCHMLLAKISALPAAEGRWEKAMQRAKENFEFLAKGAHTAEERASYEDAASLLDDYMDEARSSPPAGEKAEGAERHQRARPVSQSQLLDIANQAREAVERAAIEAKETCDAIRTQVDADLTSRSDAAQRERE
jgi:hypothetical protein